MDEDSVVDVEVLEEGLVVKDEAELESDVAVE